MDDALDRAARRLFIRFGQNAVEVAARQAKILADSGQWRDQDLALLTLTRVEALAAGGAR